MQCKFFRGILSSLCEMRYNTQMSQRERIILSDGLLRILVKPLVGVVF